MPLIKQSQSLPKRNVIILIHGEPGLGKTSLFNTCNGLLIDFEDGVGRSHGRKDTLLVDRSKGWKDVLDEEAAGSFAGYKTIGIDTPKAMLDDFQMAYVKDQDFALRKNTLKAYGAMGEEAKQFYNRIRAMGADIVNMVHSATEKDGDKTIKVPDVTGQSLQLLKRFSDQIGYMYSENGQRVIDFRIQDGVVTKDTADLGKLIIPPITHPSYEGWLLREVIDKVKERIEKMDEAQLEALGVISEWRASIDTLTGADDVMLGKEIMERYKSLIKLAPEHIKKQVQAYFMAHMAKIGWKWEGGTIKAFVNTNPKPVHAEQPTGQPVTPPVEEKKEETPPAIPPAESNPNALINPAPSTPSINADAAPAGDMFDPEKV